MPKVLFNGSIQGFSGRIGNLIFRQLPDGTTVVSEAPPKKSRRQKKRDKLKRSPLQKAHNSNFKDAAAYAKEAAKVHPVYAELAAELPMITAYNVAQSDWWHPPEIHRVECKEGRILVEATDNVLVTKVQVTILGDEEQVLEKGEAIRGEASWWEFAPHTEGRTIVAEAWDLPGNVTKFVL